MASSSFLQTIIEDYDGPSSSSSSSSSSASPWHSRIEGDTSSSSSTSSSSTGSRKLRGGLGSHRKVVGGEGSNEGNTGGGNRETNEEQFSPSPSLLHGVAASTFATSVKEAEGEETQTEETAKGQSDRGRGEIQREEEREGVDLAEIERLTSELQRVRGLLSKKDYDHNLLKLDVENTKRDLFVLRNYLETLKTLFSPSEEDAERLVWANSIHTNPGGGNVAGGAEGGGANVVHNGMQPPTLPNVSNVRSKEHKRERSLSTTDSALSSSSPLVKTTSDALEEASSSSVASSSPLLLPPLPSSGSSDRGGGKISNSPNIRAQMSISTSVLPSIPSIISIHDMAPFSQTVLRQHTHAQERPERDGEEEKRRWEQTLSIVEVELKGLVEQFKEGIEEATRKQEEGALASNSPSSSSTSSSSEVEALRKEIERLVSDLKSKEEEHSEAMNSKKSLEEALELLRKEVKEMEGKVEESESQSNWAREMAIQAVQALADEKRVLEEEKYRATEEAEKKAEAAFQEVQENMRKTAAVRLGLVFEELEAVREELERKIEEAVKLEREQVEKEELEKEKELQEKRKREEERGEEIMSHEDQENIISSLRKDIQALTEEHQKELEGLKVKLRQEFEEQRSREFQEKMKIVEKRERKQKEVEEQVRKEIEELREQLKKEQENHETELQELETRFQGIERQRTEQRKAWEMQLANDLEGQKNQITQLDEALKLQHGVTQERQEKVWAKEAEITTMKEELAVKTERLNSTEEEFEQLKKEMAGKDDVINRLSEEIKSSRRQSSQNNLNPSAASAASKEAGRPATALWEEVERLRESNQAHQNQNVLLCAEIKRLQGEMNAKLEAKDGTISRLQQQIARLQGKPPHTAWVPGSAPAALSDQSASGWSSSEKLPIGTSPGGSTSPTTTETFDPSVLLPTSSSERDLLEELAEIKKKYFFALAMETKLHLFNTRKPCNVDISELYSTAQTLQVPHSSWGQWLYQQINQRSGSMKNLTPQR